MIRRYIIPRNPWLNIYLHHIVRSDDARALHDHPWWSVSLMLAGRLFETFDLDKPRNNRGKAEWYKSEGVWPKSRTVGARQLSAGTIAYRPAEFAHRLIVPYGERGAWTLFITGPRIREWGFHFPQGWRHWRDFTKGSEGGEIGKGCD